MRFIGAGGVFNILADIGLDDDQRRTLGVRGIGVEAGGEAGSDGDTAAEERADAALAEAAAQAASGVSDGPQAAAGEYDQPRQAKRTDIAGKLAKPIHRQRGGAKRVPRKPRQHPAAQPFGQHPCRGKH